MPHVTLQISASGPVLDIVIGASEARMKALHAAGDQLPPVLTVRALIDTGASCTCVDPAILQQLNLTPTGVIPVHTPTTGNAPIDKNQYDVSLHLIQTAGPAVRTFSTVPVVESSLAIQGIQALIGRDILQKCLVIYDGQTGIFTLAF